MGKASVPIPQEPIGENFRWREWFQRLSDKVFGTMSEQDSTNVSITGGTISNTTIDSITHISSRPHNSLQSIQGGTSNQYYHLTASEYSSLASHINPYYGGFRHSSDQLFSAANTPTVVSFSAIDAANGISLSSNQATITRAGTYNIQYSIQAVNTDSQAHNLIVWLRKNGTDIVESGSKFDVPSKHGTSDGYLIAISNLLVTVAANDYIEVVAAADQVRVISPAADGVYFESYTSSSSPFTRPSIPSNLLSITQVS